MNEKGFLSMEVLLITALLTVLVSISGLYVIGGKMIVASANLTTAGFLAEKQMACVRGNKSFLAADFSGEIIWQDKADKLPLVKNGTMFTVTTTVKNYPDKSSLKHILIHVGWQEYTVARHVALESLVLADE